MLSATTRPMNVANYVSCQVIHNLWLADSSSDGEEVTSRPLAAMKPLRTLTPPQRAAADRSALARQQLLVQHSPSYHPSLPSVLRQHCAAIHTQNALPCNPPCSDMKHLLRMPVCRCLMLHSLPLYSWDQKHSRDMRS